MNGVIKSGMIQIDMTNSGVECAVLIVTDVRQGFWAHGRVPWLKLLLGEQF